MTRSLPTQSYTVVFGTSSAVTRALRDLIEGDDAVVLVDTDKPADLDSGVFFIAGDPADEAVMRSAHPERANRALLALEEDADTLVAAVALRGLAPDLELYALTRTPRVARTLSELGVRHTLAADELVGHTLAKSLETPAAGDLLLQMVDTDRYSMHQTVVGDDLHAQPLSAARAAHPGALVLGIARGESVDLGLGDDPVLSSGDNLILLEALGASTDG